MNDWDVTVIRTLEEMEAIRDVWERMQHNESPVHIDADYDRYLSVLKAADNSVKPYIILFKQKGHLKTMVIARTETRQIACRIGYSTIIKPKMRCLSVVYGGILGQPDNNACSFLVNELLRILRSREIDIVFFNHLKADSCIYQFSKKLPGILSRDYFPKVESHSCMSIPENIEDFFRTRSHNHRAKLKRYIRNLDKEFPNEVKMVTYSNESDLDKAIRDASKVSRVTYQYELGAGFKDTARTRTLLTTSARKGWLRLHILYIHGEPVAFRNLIKYCNLYIGHGMGHDSKWSKWRVGTVLFLKVLEYICNDEDIEIFDFGFGDAEYKDIYSDKQWQEASIYIFAPRFYPAFINILRTNIAALNSILEYVVKKSSLTNRIKRLWRNKLSKTSEN